MISTWVALGWLGLAVVGTVLFAWMKRRQKRLDSFPEVNGTGFDELAAGLKRDREARNAVICNTSYIDLSVMLGDTDFKYCQFIRCKLIDDGPWSMELCFMDSCTLQSANVAKSQEFIEREGERRHSNVTKGGLLTKSGDQD
jgi:hypothetical protein